MWDIFTQPDVGTGRRAPLVRSAQGNVLWDCLSQLDQEAMAKGDKSVAWPPPPSVIPGQVSGHDRRPLAARLTGSKLRAMVTDRVKSGSTPSGERGQRHGLGDLASAAWRRRIPLAVWTGVVAVGLALGWASFILQGGYVDQFRRGGVLNGWENLLRQGAPWQLLIPVAAAGLLAFIGWWRLAGAQPEPTLGVSRMEGAPVSQLRASLRRERQIVTAALEVVFALATMVGCRFIIYLVLALGGSALARSTLMGVFIEALVWALAGGGFWLWKCRYLGKLESWGVRGT
ncbi:MAG TPA: hypothetical protein VMV23_12365 [Candidatus Nanopelagicaceae bacterium]|nr:hypothetical protein [Candidatus Nanopelagicaceae bacterium]